MDDTATQTMSHGFTNCRPFMITTARPKRDRRLDVIRGIAIFAIAMNHVATASPNTADVRAYKFGHVFSFDFSDVFIIISGIVAGMYYFPLHLTGGIKACAIATFRRALTIWKTQVFCTIAAAMALVLLATPINLTEYLLGSILLFRPGRYLDILPIYIFLLLALPLMLTLFRRSPLACLLLSGGTWFGLWLFKFMQGRYPEWWPDLTMTSGFFMNPLSAQFLFFLGVFLGVRKQRINAFISRTRWIVPLAIFGLIVMDYMSYSNLAIHHFNQKEYVGPARILSLLAVLALIERFIPDLPSGKPVGLIEACGRNALATFAISTVGAIFLGRLSDILQVDRVGFAFLIMSSAAICLATGYFIQRTASRRPIPASGAQDRAVR